MNAATPGLVLATAMTMFQVPAAHAERGADGELFLLYHQPVSLLNPYITNAFKDVEAASVVLEPLARFDETGTLVPRLVEAIPTIENGGVSEDMMSITWTLLPGLLWSDGSAVTAEDIAFTYEYCSHPEFGCSQASPFADIERVEVIDELSARLVFKAPKPFPYDTFVGKNSPLIQKAQFAGCLGTNAVSCTDQNFRPIGTGPFRVVDFKTNDVATLEANPFYRVPELPAFDRVVIKSGGDAAGAAQAVFMTGEADYAWNLQIAPEILRGIIAQGSGTLGTAFGSQVETIYANLTNPDPELGDLRSTVAGGPHPFLTDPVVIRALSLALDRALIAEVGYGDAGRPVCNAVPAPERYVAPENNWCLTRDVDEANRLLDGAGWIRGTDGIRAKDGMKLVIDYVTNTNAVRQDTQALVKQMWSEIGVETELRAVSAQAFFSDVENRDSVWRFQSDVHMYTDGYAGADPQLYVANFVCAGIPSQETGWNGLSLTRYCDPEFEALVAELASTAPLEDRAAIVRKMNVLLIERGGFIPLVNRASVSGFAATLQGYKMNAWDAETWNIAEWSRAK